MLVRDKNQAGFTVVELLITLTVLSIAFLGFTTLFVNIESVSDQADDIIAANDAAFTEMQTYENTDFGLITVGAPQTEIEIENFESGLPQQLQSPRTAKVYATSLTPTLKRVRVTVTYDNNRDGEEITYVSLIHESGLGR